jgi:hypothetical protein
LTPVLVVIRQVMHGPSQYLTSVLVVIRQVTHGPSLCLEPVLDVIRQVVNKGIMQFYHVIILLQDDFCIDQRLAVSARSETRGQYSW